MSTRLRASAGLAAFWRADTVIQNATVLTVTKGTFHGSIVIRDGKIVDAGEKVMVPPGAKIIDASGQFVMPGIIDCHSHIARGQHQRRQRSPSPRWSASKTC